MNFFETEEDKIGYPIILDLCDNDTKNRIFKKTIDKYHSYKKYTSMPTRRINWIIYERISGNLVGAIGISSAVISINCRDNYIGWNKDQRIKNLGKLANNSRCCFIQKNFTLKNIGSMTFKLLSKEGQKVWKKNYNEPLVLLETFVQAERTEELNGQKLRNGSLYRSSNWIEVGKTSGVSIRKGPLGLWVKEDSKRGELARTNPKAALEKYGYKDGQEYIVSDSLPKIMFVKPLVKNWKKVLTEL